MSPASVRVLSAAAIAVLVLTLPVRAVDVPLRNWQVPIRDILGKQVDVTQAVPFVGVEPCRLVDTRGGGVFIGQYGPPALVMNATRNFDLNSAAHCPGIPVGVEAYSLNVTVVSPAGPGDIRMWPRDNPPTVTTSVQNWSSFGVAFAIANSVIMPAGTSGGVTVQMAGTTGDLLIDINGYFSAQGNADTTFDWHVDDSSQAGHFQNVNGDASSVGVQGDTQSPIDTSAGVVGNAFAATGRTYGVQGSTDSTSSGAAGVLGLNSVPFPTGGEVNGSTQFGDSGVRAVTGTGRGVVAITSGVSAVAGMITDAAGDDPATGFVGLEFGGTLYGLYSSGAAHVQGTFTALNKLFVQPHPFDASKQINYVALEGRKSEVYFRGTSTIERGITRIDVPEDFRLVARPGSYSTLITPVGEMATVAVMSEDESGILLKASRNVKVHYVVYGERAAYADHEPITPNTNFRPEFEGQFDGTGLPDSYRQLMIQNGTLTEDGRSVNAEKARAIGWSLKPEAENDFRLHRSDKKK